MKILRFKNKMSLKNKLLVIFVLILIIFIIGIAITYATNEEVRDWININILRKEITEEDVATIEIDFNETQYIYAYNNNILILSNGKLQIYNNYGSKENELDVLISNPIFKASGNYLVVAEQNGQKVYFISGGKIVWENKVEGNINKINVSRSGNVSIITEGTSYKSVIVTFDKTGKELFKTYLASTIAVATDISIDGNYLAIGEISINGAVLESSIKIIEIEKASKGDTTNSVIFKQNSGQGKIITDIKYQEKGQLVCIYDDSVNIIYEDKNEELIKFNSNTQIADINLNSYVVRTEESSTGLFNSKTDVILTNILSKSETIYWVESAIKNLTSYEEITAINLGTEVHFINLNGWLEKKYISIQEIKDVVLGTSIAGIIYRDRIKIITF